MVARRRRWLLPLSQEVVGLIVVSWTDARLSARTSPFRTVILGRGLLQRQAMQLMPQVLFAGLLFGMLLEAVGCGGSSGIRTDQSGKSQAGTGGGHSDGNGGGPGEGGRPGEGGSTIGGSGIELGAACAPRGSLACAGRHQKLTLLCGATGVWEANGTCEPGEFCQAGAGVDQGICLPEVEECRGEAPGAHVCLGDARRECGPDGVDSVLIETCDYGCVSGMCREHAECMPGWKDCDAQPDCETNLMSSSAHCGACNKDCGTEPNANGSCVEGTCACSPGYADCTDEAGCETATDANAAHCGECGRECSSGTCVAGQCAMRAFVTSETFYGNFGGLAGADQKCQALADAANLGGKFRAWLSDSNTPIAARFPPSQGPYMRVDGVLIANDSSELALGGTLQNPISVDETGAQAPASVSPYAWTGQGTDRFGDVSYCDDWTSNSTDASGLIGTFTSVEDWQNTLVAADCSIQMHLYCFEVPQE